MENITFNGKPLTFEDEIAMGIEYDPYCYVCGRCTDHVAEHDELVELGLARYDRGDVRWTPAGTFEAIDAWQNVNAFLSFLFGHGWFYDFSL
jgi:hypothetical protein